MGTATASKVDIDAETRAHHDKRDELHDRFLHAALADPAVMADVPMGVLLCLLPDDDPTFVERELVAGADFVRRGKNVYFRYVRLADLPPSPPRPAGGVPGQRRTSFNWDGSIYTQEVVGDDGEWHPVEPPQPLD